MNEEENGSRFTLETTKMIFKELLKYHLSKDGLTLCNFIETHQHKIYHLCYSSKCCRCERGRFTITKKILFENTLRKLFDTNSRYVSYHNPNSRHIGNALCCCRANPNVTIEDLDYSECRALLTNFTSLVPNRSSERKAFDYLVETRNKYTHENNYTCDFEHFEKCVLLLANMTGKKDKVELKFKEEKRKSRVKSGIFDIGLERQTCLEGENICFTCVSKHHDKLSTWSKDGREIKELNKFKRYKMITIGNFHRLDIKKVKLEDAGEYTITIDNEGKTAALTVQDFFIKYIMEFKCFEGEKAHFECQVLQRTQKVLWFKGSHELKNDRCSTISQGKHHSLEIVNVRTSDSGEYTIQVNGRRRSANLIVLAYFKDNLKDTTCFEGQTAILQCETSDKNHHVEWLRNDEVIKQSSRYHIVKNGNQHRLEISHTSFNDEGVYSAKIKYTHITRAGKLTVQEQPRNVLSLKKESMRDPLWPYQEEEKCNHINKWKGTKPRYTSKVHENLSQASLQENENVTKDQVSYSKEAQMPLRITRTSKKADETRFSCAETKNKPFNNHQFFEAQKETQSSDSRRGPSCTSIKDQGHEEKYMTRINITNTLPRTLITEPRKELDTVYTEVSNHGMRSSIFNSNAECFQESNDVKQKSEKPYVTKIYARHPPQAKGRFVSKIDVFKQVDTKR